MICYGCLDCSLERTASIVHRQCFELAKLRIRNISIGQVCDMAWILRPALAWYDAEHVLARQSPITQLPNDAIVSSTELGSLIQKIKTKLPPEVERLICEEIPVGLFSSLSSCSRTLSNLESNGWLKKGVYARQPLVSLRPFAEVSLPRFLKYDSVYILGEVCFARITVDGDARDSRDAVQLQDKPIIGIQYALGT